MSSKPLHDFQRQADIALEDALQPGSRPRNGVPSAELMSRRRSIFLAPRRELVEQADHEQRKLGVETSIIMADSAVEEAIQRERYGHASAFVASKDTLVTRLKAGRLWGLPKVDLVVADEAHLSCSPTWRGLLARFRAEGAKLLGLTATPYRRDGIALGNIYETLVSTPGVGELTRRGFLAPARYFGPSDPDLSRIRMQGGDFHRGDLSDLFERPKLVGDIVDHWLEHAPDRKTIVFCSGVRHSAAIADRLKGLGVIAEHVEGRMHVERRKDAIKRFRDGETQVLTNSDLLLYGFDQKDVDCLVIARPTQSLTLHLQMLGRGLRRSPGKSECLVLDHAGNTRRHGLADEEFEWTLDGAPLRTLGDEKKPHKPERNPGEEFVMRCPRCTHEFRPAPECPSCGYHFERVGRDIEILNGRLVEIKSASAAPTVREARYFHRQLRWLAIERGWKVGRVHYLFLERFGKPAPRAWQADEPVPAFDEVRRFVKHQNIRYSKRRRA